MPIPSSITDLEATESLNSPQGGDQVGGNIDNFLRAHASIIKRQFTKGADINSATTLVLPADGSYFNVVKVVSAITNINDNFNGRIVYLKFEAGITLTHSTSLIMPVGVSVTTELDDVCVFINDAPGIWRCVSYPRYAASDYAGVEPTITWPYMTWADTGNMRKKRRNTSNTSWIDEGALLSDPGTDHAGAEPANPVAYMRWADTSNMLLKRRNAANSAWVVVGTLATRPAFSAYASASQSITASTYTKVTLAAVDFDSDGSFSNSRYTPKVPGEYQINGIVRLAGTLSVVTVIAAIYKNGVAHFVSQVGSSSSSLGTLNNIFVGGVVEMNGTTDYLELYGYISASSGVGFDTTSTASTSKFSGFLIGASA